MKSRHRAGVQRDEQGKNPAGSVAGPARGDCTTFVGLNVQDTFLILIINNPVLDLRMTTNLCVRANHLL